MISLHMQNKTKISIIAVAILIVLGIVSRFIPHSWNMTPVGAIALFASAYFGLKYSTIAIIVLMFASDIFLGFYSIPIMISVYLGFILTALIGRAISKKKSFIAIITASLSSSFLFYIITNFAVWRWSPLYEQSFSGLVESYTMALPFFRNQLFGDLVYTMIFFGAFSLVIKYLHRPKKEVLKINSYI